MDRKDLLTVVVIGSFVLLCTLLWILDARRTRRMRRIGNSSSVSSGIIGGIDDVFHPEAARASEIREVQRELPAEAPVPGDPFRLVMRPGDRSGEESAEERERENRPRPREAAGDQVPGTASPSASSPETSAE